jgi:hypothetical protein
MAVLWLFGAEAEAEAAICHPLLGLEEVDRFHMKYNDEQDVSVDLSRYKKTWPKMSAILRTIQKYASSTLKVGI